MTETSWEDRLKQRQQAIADAMARHPAVLSKQLPEPDERQDDDT